MAAVVEAAVDVLEFAIEEVIVPVAEVAVDAAVTAVEAAADVVEFVAEEVLVPVVETIGNVVKPVVEAVAWVGDTLIGKPVEWVVDEIIEPVADFTVATIQAALDDPLVTIAKIAAMTTGNAWAIPLIDGAKAAADGEEFSEVLKTVAISYAVGKVGATAAKVGSNVAGAVGGDYVGKELVTSIVSKGTSNAAVAVLYGEDPMEAFVKGGLDVAVSATMGYIGEKNGSSEFFEDNPGLKAVPNITSKIVHAGIVAELTGQEITGEMLANAAAKGLVTTNLVTGLMAEDSTLTDRDIGYITTALQRTVTMAFDGTSGEEGLAAFNGMMSAYGTEAMHEAIDNSSFGDAVNTSMDKLTGDYEKVEKAADNLDDAVLARDNAVKSYEWLVDDLNGDMDDLKIKRAEYETAFAAYQAAEGGGNTTAEFEAAEKEYLKAEAAVEKKHTDYAPQLESYKKKITTAQDDFVGYEKDYADAVANLSVSSERLNEDLSSAYAEADRAVVEVMAPDFNEAEYRKINNIPTDQSATAHYLTTGQHESAYVSDAQYDQAMTEKRQVALTNVFAAAGVDPSLLTKAQLKAVSDNLASTYDTPEKLDAFIANPPPVAVPTPSADAVVNEATLSEGTTWKDVSDGKAAVVIDEDGNRVWKDLSATTTSWDPTKGNVITTRYYDSEANIYKEFVSTSVYSTVDQLKTGLPTGSTGKYDPETGKILGQGLPPEIRDEYDTI